MTRSSKRKPFSNSMFKSRIVSRKNSKPVCFVFPKVNASGKSFIGWIFIEQVTGHKDVLALLNKGRPSIFKEMLNVVKSFKISSGYNLI